MDLEKTLNDKWVGIEKEILYILDENQTYNLKDEVHRRLLCEDISSTIYDKVGTILNTYFNKE